MCVDMSKSNIMFPPWDKTASFKKEKNGGEIADAFATFFLDS